METAKGGYLGRFTDDRRGELHVLNTLHIYNVYYKLLVVMLACEYIIKYMYIGITSI